MKKFLVELKDLAKKRAKKTKYIVKAENMEEAVDLAIEYYKKREKINERQEVQGA